MSEADYPSNAPYGPLHCERSVKGVQTPVNAGQGGAADKQVIVIGAGPAGLAAAYELTKFSLKPMVLERRDKVGGISCTENYDGYYFDMGGHRFFTKVNAVSDMWREALGNELLRRPRSSRIYYNHKFFCYPLKPFNALLGLGFWRSLLISLSYVKWQLLGYRREDTFEQWVTNRFGRRLYETFFKAYTEKVWGIPCSELRAEWAAQRIKDLSLKTAVMSMFLKPKQTIKTLIEEFDYPRRGPGMMWNAVKRQIEGRGGVIRMDRDVVKICRTGNRIDSVTVSCNGCYEVIKATDFISSMPIGEFIEKLDPPPAAQVLEAARRLKYRDFLTVCLLIDQPDLFPDNWIYIHDPTVMVGRIQNFKNWSPDMVPDPNKTSLGLEYFCTEGDELWSMPDADLIELGKREVDRIGLARYANVEGGCVFRVPKAYPVYDSDYRKSLPIVREFVAGMENFQTIGRNGLHRYNNQDHAMLTGMLAARNLVLGARNDLWNVNGDDEYHEEIQVLQAALSRVFLKLDRVAFGLALGTAAGLLLLAATLALLLKGGQVVGPNLQLLNQYLPGYSVTAWGSLLGLVYGFVFGFVAGWGFAFLRNAALFLNLAFIRRSAELKSLHSVFEYI